MKFQIDLLPNEYKSLPRDLLSLVMAVSLIVVSATSTGVVYLKSQKSLKEIEIKFQGESAGVEAINAQINAIQLPKDKMTEIKKKVELIKATLYKKNFSWLTFFDRLEGAVPAKKCWVSGLNKTGKGDLLEFEISGEAADNPTVLEFASNLSKSGFFKGVVTRDTIKKYQGTQELIAFVIIASVGME